MTEAERRSWRDAADWKAVMSGVLWTVVLGGLASFFWERGVGQYVAVATFASYVLAGMVAVKAVPFFHGGSIAWMPTILFGSVIGVLHALSPWLNELFNESRVLGGVVIFALVGVIVAVYFWSQIRFGRKRIDETD